MRKFPSLFLLLSLLFLCPNLSATQPGEALTDPGDREAFAWLADHIGGEPALSQRGGQATITFENAPEASCRLTLDEDGRVVGINTNKAAFNNDDLAQLAGFKHLTSIRNDHNFDDEGPNGYREGPNPMSGAGWIAFKDHDVQDFRIAGCNFDGDGLRAVAQFPNLRHLDVFHTRVTDEDLQAIKGHPTLESFNAGPMWDDKIDKDTLVILGTIPNLKKFKLVETYLPFEGGFDQVVKLGDQLETITLGNTVVSPEDLEKLKAALPHTTIEHEGPEAIGKLILENWKGADKKLSKWAPAEVIEVYRAAAQE